MAATKKQQTPVVDPKFELAEMASSYVLRLALPDLNKSDFRVQVDGAGRLTVRGTRTGTLGSPSLHKVFQLPSAANLDDIAGRFEAGVLTLTVPKRATGAGAAPTSVEENKRKMPDVAKDTRPKEEEIAKEDASSKKAMGEATKKTQQQQKQEEDASKSKPTQVKEEEVKPKVPQAPSTAPPQEPAPVKKQEEMKPKAPQEAAAATPPREKPAPKPEPATGIEKAKAAVTPDSLAERVRRRGVEEQRAKAAAAVAEKEAKAEQEKGAAAACINGWKERAMGELKGLTDMKWAEGLTDMKWADGVVEAARKNKEVVAVGIAAFSLGFLISQKLFRK
ncbi:unnamed protein product [Alopecurus aequalis]